MTRAKGTKIGVQRYKEETRIKNDIGLKGQKDYMNRKEVNEMIYHEINEKTAKQAFENYSMSDYRSGSDTNEYKGYVDEFAKLVKDAKTRVESQEQKDRLDALLDRFSKRLANWFNKKNSVDSHHVSWAISGPSNYNMKAHEKWERATDKLWAEFKDIMSMKDKINTVIRGDKIIKSGDADAVEKLQAKIGDLKEKHARIKQENAEARKAGTDQHNWYELPYLLAEIKRLETRLNTLKAAKEQGNKETEFEDIEGLKVVENTEIMRIQLIFDGKPSTEIRDVLKSNGFKWSGKNAAWQRQLTNNAIYATKIVIKKIHSQLELTANHENHE